MASGFASWCRLARTGPPSTRSTPDSSPSPTRHVFLGSRFRLRLPPHPASRLSSCHRLVVGAINLHRGLAPPSCWSCRAHTVRAVLPHTALRHRSPAGIRKRRLHRPVQAIDAELGRPLIVEAGNPVAALESVLGAGDEREAFVDVAVDLVELPPRVPVAEVVAPTTQNAVEIFDHPLQ